MSAPATTLVDQLPDDPKATLDADQVLERFVAWSAERGLELYPAQEEAILELLAGNHVVLNTPTGSGKSLVATAHLFATLAKGGRGFYTCPIKALVNEKFFQLCEVFGPDRVGLMTGDASVNRDAPIICCTAEILSNLCLREAKPSIDAVVMDEFHYYSDRERGVAWQLPLLVLESAQFLLMSATLGDMQHIEASLEEVTGRAVANIRSVERPVPLDFSYVETPLHETVKKLIAQNKAPIYLVNFTQRAAAEQAQNLMSVDFSTKEEKEAIRDALAGVKFDSPYGKELQRFLRHGVGLHHAGLLPRYRLLVERIAQQGLLKVVSGTDTLGVGINIPLRTVLFTQLCTFDGDKVGILSARDFHQIAGRAGRKGYDTAGSVVVQAPEHVIENLKLAQKAASGKKIVKQKPPTKGYAHWDASIFETLLEKRPEPLESRFHVTHGMLLHLLQAAGEDGAAGYRRLVWLVGRSHGRAYDQRRALAVAARAFRTLRQANLVVVERGRPPKVHISEALQRDFSLNHTLSLYLLEAIEALDRAQETYPLDVVSVVESILENPGVVLAAQLRRAKDRRMAEMKAQGMEYEERMEELEKVEIPKPLAEFIYPTFNLFAAKHPWVGSEAVRPKSIAREVLERFCTFADYIRDYGLQRSEGVLLRYLSDAYKALRQNVPEAAKTPELDDLIAHLRQVVRGADSSLVDEWERMRDPDAVIAQVEDAAPIHIPVARDERARTSRIRAELHQLTQLLGRHEWEEAASVTLDPEARWTPVSIEEATLAYEEATGGPPDTFPRSRRPHLTQIEEEAPLLWRVRHTLLDAEGEAVGFIEGVVDLREDPDPAGPMFQLERIAA